MGWYANVQISPFNPRALCTFMAAQCKLHLSSASSYLGQHWSPLPLALVGKKLSKLPKLWVIPNPPKIWDSSFARSAKKNKIPKQATQERLGVLTWCFYRISEREDVKNLVPEQIFENFSPSRKSEQKLTFFNYGDEGNKCSPGHRILQKIPKIACWRWCTLEINGYFGLPAPIAMVCCALLCPLEIHGYLA